MGKNRPKIAQDYVGEASRIQSWWLVREDEAVVGEGSGYKVFTESLLWLQEQQGMEPALEDFTTVSFIHGTHAFIQQILTEQLLCGRHCVELQDAEANKTNKSAPMEGRQRMGARDGT